MSLAEEYLSNRLHWHIFNVRDLASFFRALPRLAPEGTSIGLSDCDLPPEIQASLAQTPASLVGRGQLSSEFVTAFYLAMTESNMEILAELADSHAEPEIAIHIAAFTRDGPFLEWFDVRGDPIIVSRSTVSEEAVFRFAREIGGLCVKDVDVEARRTVWRSPAVACLGSVLGIALFLVLLNMVVLWLLEKVS